MIGSCSSISLQVTRKGGRLMIGWAYERVYTVSKLYDKICVTAVKERINLKRCSFTDLDCDRITKLKTIWHVFTKPHQLKYLHTGQNHS